MSTRARKDRKKAGIPFTKPQKTPTPLEDRAFVNEPVYRRRGDLLPMGMTGMTSVRSPRRIRAFLLSGGRPNVALPKGGEK